MLTDGFLQLLPDNDHRCEQLWILAAEAADRSHLWEGPGSAQEAPLRNKSVRVTVLHPGGGIGRFVDRIVAGGERVMLILHSGYLHPTTECSLTMPTLWGASDDLTGKVRQCMHLTGTVHMVEVLMEREIDLSRYVEGYRSAAASAAAANPTELSGRVLVVDNLGINLQLVDCVLKSTRIQSECHTTLPAALERLRRSHVDLVVCDAHLEPGRDEGIVGLLRGASHRGGVLLLIGDPKLVRPADQELTAREAALRMPAAPAALLEQIAALLHSDPSRRLPDQIESSLASETRLHPLLRDYCEFARQQGERIRTAMNDSDTTVTRGLCQELRENGGSFGFDLLSQAAAAAVTALDSTGSVQESLGELDYLLGAAERLRAPMA